MKISVSFATIRYGWLENTFRCLGQQTLPHMEWELIMVDDVPNDRSDQVLELAKKENINVKWMRSKQNYWKSSRMLGNARNTGFIHSDGELVVFIDDYTWISPTFLQKHWEIYSGTKKAIIGRVQSVGYKDSVQSSSELVITGEDDRYKYVITRGLPSSDSIYGWFYTFNASASFKKIQEINGYDEEFDCTGEDDIDLGERLSRSGLDFIYVTESDITVFHMQHEGKMPLCGVSKELYNTKYDGSWGLLERNKRRKPWEVNIGYFDLSDARNNRDKYPYKEYKIN